jgi:hypothetical protein
MSTLAALFGHLETSQNTEPKNTPSLLPVTLVLCLLYWIIATTGGHQLFVKELLGSAYDSQGEHFLRGDVNVDVEDIRSELFVVNSQVRMYFGPYPALFRIPLNFIHPSGRGAWSRAAGFCGGVLALISFAGLVGAALQASPLSRRQKTFLGSFCLLGFALGSPLLLLVANPTIYNEAILWGLSWSLAALYFAVRTRRTRGKSLTRALLGFSFCAGAALLSRATFATPLLLMIPVLGCALLRNREMRNLAALVVPASISLLSYLFLNHARFGMLGEINWKYFMDARHKDFAQDHGIFDLHRVHYSLADYLFLARPFYENNSFPFLQVKLWHWYPHPTLFVMPYSDVCFSLLYSSPWVLFGATVGVVFLLWPQRTDWIDRGIALAFFVQVATILSFQSLAQRYITELYPFLVFCLFIGLRGRMQSGAYLRVLFYGLIVVSVAVNILASASVLGQDTLIPLETRRFWTLGVCSG